MAAVDRQHGGPVGMAGGQVGQRFGIAEGGEAVAAPPVEGGAAIVPEKPVGLLHAGIQQEAGQNVQIGLVAGQLEGAPQHGRGEEHVFHLVVGVGRGGHAVVVAGAVAIGCLHEQVGVAIIPGRGGQFVGPDEAGQVGAAIAAGGKPRLGAGHVGCGESLRYRRPDRRRLHPTGPAADVR